MSCRNGWFALPGTWDTKRAGNGDGAMSILYKVNFFFDCLAAYFLHKKHLHTARFARLHELFRMSIDKLHISKKITGLFLAIGHFNQILSVFPTKTQKELANVLIIGK